MTYQQRSTPASVSPHLDDLELIRLCDQLERLRLLCASEYAEMLPASQADVIRELEALISRSATRIRAMADR